MTRNPFYLAMYQTNLLYGVKFNNEDDFAEIALNAWSIIGNKECRLYKFEGLVDCTTLSLDLPCNCDEIEAVLAPGENWNYTTNTLNDGSMTSAWIEEYIEHRKRNSNPYYAHGHYIHYLRVGNTLYFEKPYAHVLVLYKGFEVDDDGLPYLNDKEMNAIATYVAWILTFKDGLATNNNSKLQMALQLLLRWNIQCDLARTPEYLNQNDMNEIADAKSRWTQLKYGRSYKPIMK